MKTIIKLNYGYLPTNHIYNKNYEKRLRCMEWDSINVHTMLIFQTACQELDRYDSPYVIISKGDNFGCYSSLWRHQ